MKSKRITAIVALGGAAVLALSACAPAGGDGGGGDDDKVVIGFVVKASSNPVWQGVIRGAEAKAAELGIELRVTGAESEEDVTGQLNKIQDLITGGVDALVVAPNGAAQALPVLQQAADDGIPVVLLDTDIDGFADKATHVTSNQTDSSHEVNQLIVDALGADAAGAPVGILDYPGNPTVQARVDAAVEVFEAAGLDIVSTLPGNCDRATALDAATDMLTAHPDLVAIFGSCGQGATGAAQAVKNAQLDVLVTGFDGIEDEFNGIEDGSILATILQDFEGIGAKTVESALAALDGEELEEHYEIPGILITKENVGDYQPI